MKKFTLSLFVCGAMTAQAQSFQRCYSREAIVYQEQLAPGYSAHVDDQFAIAKSWSQEHTPKRDVYMIPVVFHIVYNTESENLPDSVLENQIAGLNADYARQNADTVNMRSEFYPVAGATTIQFFLAGVTRTSTDTESFGSFDLLMGDFTDLEKVKSTADGGHDPWDQSRYLNIWICDMSINDMTMLLGYATPPDDLPNWPEGSAPELIDGVVLQYQVVGSNNPNDLGIENYTVKGRTATHEVGHYLGLRHIWGDGDCTMDDGISDTPDADASSEQDCDDQKNSCNADVNGLGDLHDMIENFMDYSAETCQNSFTQEQASLMHGVLENQRYDLVHNNPAGLNELSATVSCYPNPTTGIFNVVSSAPIESISVSDMNGKLLHESTVNASKATIDLQPYQAGVYTLLIRNANGMIAQQRIAVTR